MIYCGTWCANIFIGEGFDNFAMFRFPAVEGGKGDPGAGFLVPQGFMVSAKTKHPAEAAAWASFLVSDEMAAKFAEAMGAIPSNAKLIDTVKGTEQYKWIVNDIAAATGSVMVLDVLLEASVSNAYLDAGVEILNGTKTPQQAMDVHPRAWRSKPRPKPRCRPVRWSSRPDRSAPRFSLGAVRVTCSARFVSPMPDDTAANPCDVRRPARGSPLDVGSRQAPP